MAAIKQNTKKKFAGRKTARKNAKATLEVKVERKAPAGGEAAPGIKLTDRERKEIIGRVMAAERARGRVIPGGREDEPAQVEKQKRLIMWSGVTFFMILIAVFWIYNMKLTVRNVSLSSEEGLSLSRWQELTEELEKRMTEVNEDAEAIGAFGETETKSATASPEDIFGEAAGLPGAAADANGVSGENGLTDDRLDEAIKKLENKLEDNGR